MFIGGHDMKVAEWAGRQLGVTFNPPLTAFAVVDSQNVPRGAAIFNDYQGKGGNLELTYVGKLSRDAIREIGKFAFEHCEASRLTCRTGRSNKAVQAMLRKAGFTYEAVLRGYRATGADRDVVSFALFRKDAKRWLASVSREAKVNEAA